MNNKKYKRDFLCGRFSHIHRGHQRLINRAIAEAEEVLVVVGSAQESGTYRNPFTAELRARLIKTVYPDPNVKVSVLPDLTDENDIRPEWGRYLLNHVVLQFDGQSPDLMVYGNDESRGNWFDEKDIQGISEVIVPREDLVISATQMRQYIANNDFWHWSQYADEKLRKLWPEIQTAMANAKAYWGKVTLPQLPNGDRILCHTKWLELRMTANGYVYTHDPWCNSVGVAILPYHRNKLTGNIEYLVVEERRPCHSDRGLYAITGGYDNSDKYTLAECALNELKEEGGYLSPANLAISLGSINISRSSDVRMELFAVEIAYPDDDRIEPTGDGTKLEEDMAPVWASEDEAMQSQDPVLMTLLLKLRHTLQ